MMHLNKIHIYEYFFHIVENIIITEISWNMLTYH